MNSLEAARERIESATDLPGILDASYGAFMTLLGVVKEQQHRGGPLFAAYVIAGVSVAGGRFAIAEAPSLPRSSRLNQPVKGPDVVSTAAETAVAIADLCQVLVRRLDEAGPTAHGPGDRQACREAARHANALRARFGGAP